MRLCYYLWDSTGSSLIDYHLSTQPSVGVVIVDPATKEVVAMAHTDPNHPTRHAVMVCIDGVAKRQGGGAWNGNSERKEHIEGRGLLALNQSRISFKYIYSMMFTSSVEECL